MNRTWLPFLLIIFFSFRLSAQINLPPAFKNGRIPAVFGILHAKMDHQLWKSSLFENKYYVLVHVDHIPGETEKASLASRGIELGKYISGNNYLAIWKDNGNLKSLEQAVIKEIYAIPPELKINPKLRTASTAKQGPEDLIAVNCFRDVEMTVIQKELQIAGARIIPTKIQPAHTIFIQADLTVLEKIARLPFVASINPQHLKDEPINYNNRAIHGVQSLAAMLGRNLQGKGITVGIGDNADPSTHIDFSGRLIMRTDEPVDYHGTHTSGTVAGGGILNPLYKGMAPRARLVVNDFSNIIVNSPTYLSDYKMILTNNSYYNGLAGCPGEGDYDALSNYADSQLIAYPKLLHVFAAGNDGALACSPFPGSFATIKSGFQTAKNVLTVGAISNTTYTIGSFSSRGPVADGRIKPEVVAGGVGIISTLPWNSYGGSNGTSMAAPTVTGILALIYERYRQLHGGADPDAALVKTLVSNSADDLGNPGPDFTYGFGMINARTSVEALEQNHYFTGSVNNNGNQTFIIPGLPVGTQQIKVMLYWPDPAALPLAPNTLINDLDLTVTDPSGSMHLPLILDPSAGGVNNNAVEGPDHINNMEQVVINSPPAGDFSLTVKGNAVPQGPQAFYIAYEIIAPSVKVEYPFGSETLVPGETETIRWSAYGGDPNSFTLEYSTDGGSSWNLINNTIPSTARSYPWTVPAIPTKNALVRITRNAAGYTGISDYPFTILGQPVLNLSNPCAGYAQMIWNTVPGANLYEIMKLSGDTMQVIGNTTDTSFLVTPLNKDSSYWFTVRAVIAGMPGRRAIAGNIIPNGGACALTGLNNDLVMDDLKVPATGRLFTSSQLGNMQLQAIVRNAGSVATSSPVNFSYQVNSGAIVNEIFSGSIPAHASGIYTFSLANSYDFSSPGTYNIKTWIHYVSDPINSNDTFSTTIRQLKNDQLVLNPSFTEGFESALDQTLSLKRMGLDSLDRADFSNSNLHGRLSTFFNSGFARTGNRSITLDVINKGIAAADTLITTFNLSNYTNTDQIWLDLYYKKQSPLIGYPGNYIWIRGNDQAAWIPVKSLADPADPAGIYIHVNVDVSGTLAKASPAQAVSSSFQVRCGSEGFTPAASNNPVALPGGGISFDDFMLTKSHDDAGMAALLQPSFKNICALSNAEKVSVVVRNYGTDTLRQVPVAYAVNADTVREIIPVIYPKDSINYTFSRTADMSAFQLYHFKTWVSYPADNYRFNDSSNDYAFQTTPLIQQYPYLEGFESNDGYWFTGGLNDDWQWGKPAKTIIHKAANGSKAWVTNLTGNYNDNEYAFLYSPCFDLSSLSQPVLSFSHIFKMEDDCNCDFHWVEYSLDDSVWTLLGNASTGVNWYDNATVKAWQKSNPRWHVSSFDIPVKATKVRFRIVMYSDPGTNYEGVGIDDVHIFDKAPVFADSLHTLLSQPVSGNGWIHFEQNGKRVFSINPEGQDLGNTRVEMFLDSGAIRDTAGQYYGARNWVIRAANKFSDSVKVRYYFTDSEMNKLINATGCVACPSQEDAYASGITQYSSPLILEEDSALHNNLKGSYLFHKPQQNVQIIPYDNGYYAELSVNTFSEFWINGGGVKEDHPLAAWLKDFTATLLNQTGVLNWTTWQETGSSRFVIERSGDSIHFIPIGTVTSRPHADSTADYSFTDPQLLGGPNYYRLKLVYQNGDSLYSSVRLIYFDPDPVQIRVYPNPTDGQLNINSTAECREIQIFDAVGRLLFLKETSGFQQTLSLSPFSRGIYMMKLRTDKGSKLLKIQKR